MSAAAAVEAVHPRSRATSSTPPPSWRFCLLLGAVTVGNQAAARVLIAQRRRPTRASAIAGLAVARDLAVLGVFKYYGVLRRRTSPTRSTTSVSGLPLPLLTIALPVGVSFFTFQAISYVVDVKRRLVEPATLDRRRGLPELLPAPRRRADRARARVPARSSPTPRDPNHVAVGLRARADRARAGQEGRDRRLSWRARSSTRCSPSRRPTRAPDVALAAYAYAAQIYCDFSGYTDIAIGLALLMGFVFPQNFHSPYRATGLPRLLAPLAHDAVALPARLPLHPARRQPRRTAADVPQPDDHDAARRAVARRGVDVRALGRVPRRGAGHRARARRARSGRPAWLRWLVTFHLVVLGWILFRSQSLALAGDVPRAARRRPARRRCGRCPVVAGRGRGDRAAAAAGATGRATAGASGAPAARWCSAPDSPCSSCSSARRCPSQGVRSVHLLPVLMPPAARRQPDEPLRPARPARGSARATRVARGGSRAPCCWSCSRARRSDARARQMNPGVGRDVGAGRRQTRGRGSPTGCRSRTLRDRRDRVAVARRRARRRRRLRGIARRSRRSRRCRRSPPTRSIRRGSGRRRRRGGR